jgi:hypothetical protein
VQEKTGRLILKKYAFFFFLLKEKNQGIKTEERWPTEHGIAASEAEEKIN